jgi:hypothetical protein
MSLFSFRRLGIARSSLPDARGRAPAQRRRDAARSQRLRSVQQLEQLEHRRVMAFDLVSAYAESLTPFYVSGDAVATPTLVESPQQITLRFSPGVVIDSSAASLSSISMRRSGRGGDAFGPGGSATDVPIDFGSILIDDAPNQNQIVIRFKDTLPDDTYQIIVGAGLRSANRGTVNASTIDLRLQLGAFVRAVVPQPVTRVGGALSQARDSVDVYFNTDEPLLKSSAETASLYRLIAVDAAGDDVGTALVPSAVTLDAATGRARLRFATDLPDNAVFRLEIGGQSVTTLAPQAEGTDENSTFAAAQNLGTLGQAAGAASPTLTTLQGSIDPRAKVKTPVGDIGFPSQPGTVDEPGHRNTTVDSGSHGLAFARVDPATGITVIEYNFRPDYGSDPQGNPLQNVITEAQKQRAREIFELYSLVAGVRFVETPEGGITIATGDLRALDPNTSVTGVAGLGGLNNVVLNSTIDWGESEYGGYWFDVAMHEIGHALGLDHSYDLPSIMGGTLPGEAVFPGDYDIVHLRQLYAASGADVDLYRFELPEPGTFSAETVIARPGQEIASELDSVLSLYREDVVNGKPVRTLVARNDDYYGRDSFVGLTLERGTYFLAVSSVGNTAFNAELPDSGIGGRTEGLYEARLRFTPASTAGTTVVDVSGTALDGDRDGAAGGVHSFWFRTAALADTVFVDKSAAAGGSGSLAAPYSTIKSAIDAIGSRSLIRIIGNDAGRPYLIGTDLAGRPLADGSTFTVPKGVTAMIDAGAILKLRAAMIDVGSSSPLAGTSRAGATLQVLGTPGNNVVFTSYHDDSVGGDSDGVGPAPSGGQWGGIVFREDSDAASKKAFVNTVSQATLSYGGGQVLVDSQLVSLAPIQLESARPTIAFSTVTRSAGPALAATPNSFEDSPGRIGPELRGNRLTDNSINGLFIKIDTGFGRPLEHLDVPARLRSTDVVYVLQENLVITGGAGGYLDADGTGVVVARNSGRLAVDPGVVVKMQGARIELERGTSQLIAEGSPGQRVIITALGDNRFGAGGSFDTNGNQPDKFDAFGNPVGGLTGGDWGGIIANAGSKVSLDQASIAFGGGTTPIEGTFDAFNVIEVHQAELRLTNSRLENNASGRAVSTRNGRGTNDAATVFVRGAQPIIVANDFRANAGAVVSINANSLSDVDRPDTGRNTGGIDRFTGFDDNAGPLIRGNRMSFSASAAATAGMVVRAEQITVEGVWDDTDIVHVVTGEIIVKNFHTATGLRLVSRPTESLIVKLLGPNAGFTASGYGLDIDDRIGGTVQIVGQPSYPVIVTSLRDDSVGAGLDPLGNIVKDTNTDGGSSSASANDWRSLKFMPYSNDRNVAIAIEAEKAYTGGLGRNDSVTDAQALGVLAGNFATGSNSADSAQEKSGDANRRLGFEVYGTISPDTPSDVDTYQFTGSAGSEVWLDLDKTSSSLDAMIELLDAAGNVLARSVDSALEGGVVNNDFQLDIGLAADAVYTLAHGGAVAESLTGVIYDFSDPLAPVPVQTFTCAADGVLTFRNVLGQPASPAVSGGFDAATGEVTITYAAPVATVVQFQYRYVEGSLSAATRGIAQALGKDAWRGGDFYSLNPRDPGMRVVLPGPVGASASYFIRVRSQPRYDATTTAADYEAALADPAKLAAGVSSGGYELRIRMRQRDEKPGSTVRYADIRYPATGIDVQGLPRNSLLAGETGETAVDANDAYGTAQYVGNLLQTDRNTISIAGRISTATDVDWYTFALNYEQIQAIAGVNDSGQTFATMFDIDYADGFRGDLTLSVFDDSGRLIYVGRDSNVADDQPGAGQGNDFDDLSRGSVGVLDPFIGSVTLPAGTPTNAGGFTAGGQVAAPAAGQQRRYYVAVSSNEQLPAQLNFTFQSAAANPSVRLEPISSVRRVVEDHIGFSGYTSGSSTVVAPATAKPLIDVLNLSAHATPFTLRDVTLFASSPTGLFTHDAVTGVRETTIRTGITGTRIGDLDMRRDGKLYAYAGVTGTGSNATAGRLLELDPGDGNAVSQSDDGIPNPDADDPLNFETRSDDVTALAFRRTSAGSFSELWFAVSITNPSGVATASKLYRADNGGTATTDANATANQKYDDSPTEGFRGTLAGMVVTGMQFVDEVGAKILGVTRDGRFIEITPGNKTDPDDIAPINAAATTLQSFAPQLQAIGATGFEGLASAPLNLQAGRFAGTLFALTDNGRLCAIDPVTSTLVDVPEWGGFFSPSLGTGLTGIAFSPLDFNLWNPTTARGGEAGHGVPAAADGSRDAVAGGQSMYFGLQEFDTTPQFGVMTAAVHQDLTAGAAIGSSSGRQGNYNLPGGAYGSLTTNAFSLAGYEYADKPTLYFTYFLETQGASSRTDPDGMRDSARALISTDGGLTWSLLATNNSVTSTADTTDAELPAFASVSSKISTNANQHVQQLFDGTGAWRQARVDLGQFAGSASIQLRFDFSTAGEFDATQPWSASRTTQAAVAASDVVVLDSVADLQVGDAVAGKGIPANVTVAAVDAATNEVTLSGPVTLPAAAVLSFTSASRLLNNIADKAGTTGNFTNAERGQQNDFEGFYIDDIIVGFAERGEMVTGAAASQTDFFALSTPPNSNTVPVQTLFSEYQLEIRRGTDHLMDGQVYQVFDTNTGLIGANSRALGIGDVLGDANLPREQGSFVIENNLISNAGGYGILVDAAGRDGESDMPHPGVARNLPVLNGSRLVAGTVIANNVIAASGTAGILFSGDTNTGPGPAAVVPFGKIVNNTIFGGLVLDVTAATVSGSDTVTLASATSYDGLRIGMLVSGPGMRPGARLVQKLGNRQVRLSATATATAASAALRFIEATTSATGVSVTENAGPTLLNNVFANLATGVRVDASSAPRTVVATSAFANTTTAVTGVVQSQGITLANDPFVNAAAGNFYPVQGSTIIDSALNSLQDRTDFIAVNAPVGIGASPILAPDRDLFGQLRSDDPGQASQPGLGGNVFKDRGAIDRVDFAQPFAAIATPLDEGADDLAGGRPDVVVLRRNARTQTSFVLQLSDVGIGIDNSTVARNAFVLAWEGTPLVEGTDYVFRYLETSNRVVFESAAVYRLGTYTITATTRPSSTGVTGLLTDLANNTLLPNGTDGSTSFRITLAEPADAPTSLAGTTLDGGIQLSWTPPAQTNGSAIVGYEIETSSTGAFPGVIQAVSSTAPTADVTGLVNGMPYLVRVRAVNAVGAGPWSATVGPVMPLAAPAFALVNDTGDSTSDGVSSDGLVAVTGLQLASGAAWQVSVDNGGSWVDGLAATSFTLPDGTYAAGTIQVRQTFPAGNPATSGIGSNAAAITITSAAPAVTITSDRSLIRSTGTALITFALSKASTTFTAADVAVTGGTITGFAGSGASYTATFVPNGATSGTVEVAAGAFADVADNANTAGTLTPSITIDDVAPSVAIASSRPSLKARETATLTFTLSEPATGFTAADVVVTGGTLSAFSGSGTSYSAVFTPTTNSTADGTVTVAAGAFTDAAGNGSLAAALASPIAINTVRPTVAIASSLPALRAGQTATITFTLSEPSTTFGINDVTVSGGTLSAFSGSGATYTAVFTPAVALTAPGTIAVIARSFTNAAGNDNPPANLTPSIVIDTVVPTISLASNRSALRAGETAVITFALSKPSTSFTADDVTVAGGSLSGFTGSGTTYSALFTPAATFTGSGTIGVAAGAFTDAAGNPNPAAAVSPALAIDTAVPSVAIATSRPVLRSLRTATLTFTLSEPSSTFTAADVAVTGGTLSDFSGSGTTYTAIFTPFVSSTGSGTVAIAAGSFTDAAGNPSLAGALAPPMVIDTVVPTLAITASRTTLKAGETATVFFVLSKPSTTFTADDVVVGGGTLSGFTGSGTSYTATFTPFASSTVPGTVTVAEKMFFDSVNNPNTAGSLAPPLVIDTVVPGIEIASNKAALKAGETATISFTLSKPSTTFAASDVTVTGGTLSGFFGSGASYSAIFTPRTDSNAAGGISVAAGAFTDTIGNPNRAGSLPTPLAIDTLRPTVAVATDRTVLRSARTATLTFTLSEPSTSFGLNDVAVTGGTLSAFAGSGASYTAVFTPFVSSTTPGAVTIAAGTFTDAAGNPSLAGSLTPAMVIDTVRPAVTITSPQTTLRAGETALISFALSKPSTSFGADDVTVTGGTLSGFTGSGANYSAVFTPTASSTVPGTITVAARTFFDAVNNPNMAGALTPPLAINTVVPAVSQAFVETTPLATTAAAAPAFATAFRRINLTFTGIAAGLNVSAFKLYYTGSGGSATAVSLAGAVISGSGSSYSIRLPATAATLRGSYQLDIGGPGTSVTVDGQPMPRVSSFFWRLP